VSFEEILTAGVESRFKDIRIVKGLTSVFRDMDVSIRACTIGYEAPLSLAAFKSEMTRSYAIILLCICRVRLGVVLAYHEIIAE
jgi:hypothetical protein